MGWFTKSRTSGRSGVDEEGALTLAQSWQLLGEQLGLTVEVLGDEAIRAVGPVGDRSVQVEVLADPDGVLGGAVRDFARAATARRVRGGGPRRTWRTVLAVSCTNPRGLRTTITSAVDPNDPAWNPRVCDPAQGRAVRCDPADHARFVCPPAVHERLMAVADDVTIEVEGRWVRLAVDAAVRTEVGYIGGSIIHQLPRSIPTWPERGIAGPPWWIGTLSTIADAVDHAS